MISTQLQDFRQELYDTLGTAKDALFDLMDTLLVSACITSFVSLSQSPVVRRQWGSTYAGLQDSRLPRGPVLKRLVQKFGLSSSPCWQGMSVGSTDLRTSPRKTAPFPVERGVASRPAIATVPWPRFQKRVGVGRYPCLTSE
jgi:hypothetical protein